MPRLPPTLLRHARSQHPLLPLLLRQTRTLSSALTELRYLLRELPAHPHPQAQKTYTSHLTSPSALHLLPPHRSSFSQIHSRLSPETISDLLFLSRISGRSKALLFAALARSRGVPLQYLLGTQPFLDLDVKVGPEVLIPRAETEEWTARILGVLRRKVGNWVDKEGRGMLIIDACAGSGCIGLSVANFLAQNISSRFKDLEGKSKHHVLALELSPFAIKNAQENARRNRVLASSYTLQPTNILSPDHTTSQILSFASSHSLTPTLLLSNPPYIFPSELLSPSSGVEARSVRRFEPEIALYGDDEFYEPLMRIAEGVGVGGVVMEVGGDEQAERVRGMVCGRGGWEVRVWRDLGGRGRCVVAWREGWGELGEEGGWWEE